MNDYKIGRKGTACAVCGKGNMVIKWGRNGRFLACSEYPKCRNTRPIEEEEIRQKAEMAKDPNLTYPQAYTKAVTSEEGQVIYNKRLEG